MISEAIVAGTPVIASRIAGNVGLLGEDYPGYFEVGDTRELTRLLARASNDPNFLSSLSLRCEERKALFTPVQEDAAWRRLLAEVDYYALFTGSV